MRSDASSSARCSRRRPGRLRPEVEAWQRSGAKCANVKTDVRRVPRAGAAPTAGGALGPARGCLVEVVVRPRYVRNLHVVERDLLGVDETEIELP